MTVDPNSDIQIPKNSPAGCNVHHQRNFAFQPCQVIHLAIRQLGLEIVETHVWFDTLAIKASGSETIRKRCSCPLYDGAKKMVCTIGFYKAHSSFEEMSQKFDQGYEHPGRKMLHRSRSHVKVSGICHEALRQRVRENVYPNDDYAAVTVQPVKVSGRHRTLLVFERAQCRTRAYPAYQALLSSDREKNSVDNRPHYRKLLNFTFAWSCLSECVRGSISHGRERVTVHLMNCAWRHLD